MTRITLAALIGAALVFAGVMLGKDLRSDELAAQERASRTAPLRVVDNGLAFVDPDGCEEFVTAGGLRSARIPETVVENLGDQAMIVSTEFRVQRGESQEWQSFRTWRVPVDGHIGDVRLLRDDKGGGNLQTVEPGVTRCWLFVERKGTYLPPLTGPPPRGPGAKLGVEYPYSWYTHCGATILPFDGRWWKPSPPLSSDRYNPPPGWDDDERGTIVLLAKSSARFTTSRGQIANLIPTATPHEDPFGGCE